MKTGSTTHGMSETVEFSIWTDIQTRCYNKKSKAFPNYGGRGIKVCSRWLNSFENFFSDMGARPEGMTLDRKDNDGDYSPNNCRWATRIEQANNKRCNHKITIDGVTKNMALWAKEYGLSSSTILYRERAGVTGIDLVAPVNKEGCLTMNGESNTYAGWSKKTGIKLSTIAMRIHAYKWPIEKALTKGAKL